MFFRFLKALFRRPLLALLFPLLLAGLVFIYPIIFVGATGLHPLVIAGLGFFLLIPLPGLFLLVQQVRKQVGADSLSLVADEMSEEFSWGSDEKEERV
jgi:hypothetical protein